MDFDTEITYVKSVGPKRAELFHKLGVFSVRDLLHLFPRSYLDMRAPKPIAQVMLGETAPLRATVLSPVSTVRLRPGMEVSKTRIKDGSGTCDLVFFNRRFAAKSLNAGETYLFYGRMDGNLLRRELVNPYIVKGKGELLPVYPLTEGLNQAAVRKAMENALLNLDRTEEVLPPALAQKQGLCSRAEAFRMIHRPADGAQIEKARKRLCFEELLVFTLKMARLKRQNRQKSPFSLSPVDMEPFYARLPFPLTGAQKRVISEALGDYASPYVQNRLIQGDVGSGKTAVAAAVCYFVIRNRHQAALIAPTEVLAQQHYQSFSALFAPFDIRVALLTGSTPAGERKALLTALKNHEIDLLIGTHALITEQVAFADLALVITDEQHRFGVRQRKALSDKGRSPHVLVMSATPIPRTLALILYADLDVSQIDELPPGRKPVHTYAVTPDLRERLYGFVRKNIEAGRQAYIICARAEEDGESELADVRSLTKELESGYLKGIPIACLYGKMPAKKKEETLAAFYSGELKALVSTTVVEVGVNVPNATVMVIENAERFGLSQLHQLRGRVGRGAEQSHCILVSASAAENERLKVMTQTNDGFEIARRDLAQRGPGEFFGERQSGLTRFKIADLMDDMQTLLAARDAASALLKADPGLVRPEHAALKQAVEAASDPSPTI